MASRLGGGRPRILGVPHPGGEHPGTPSLTCADSVGHDTCGPPRKAISMTGDARSDRDAENADVVGMWVTVDGHIRQELLPDGRYDEARGDRRSAYTGRYTVSGSHLTTSTTPGSPPRGTSGTACSITSTSCSTARTGRRSLVRERGSVVLSHAHGHGVRRGAGLSARPSRKKRSDEQTGEAPPARPHRPSRTSPRHPALRPCWSCARLISWTPSICPTSAWPCRPSSVT